MVPVRFVISANDAAQAIPSELATSPPPVNEATSSPPPVNEATSPSACVEQEHAPAHDAKLCAHFKISAQHFPDATKNGDYSDDEHLGTAGPSPVLPPPPAAATVSDDQDYEEHHTDSDAVLLSI